MTKVQLQDIPEANEAMNSVLVEVGDVEQLRSLSGDDRNFDQHFGQLRLGRQLEEYLLLRFRCLSYRLLTRCGKHEDAISLAQRDFLYGAMIDVIAASEAEKHAEECVACVVQEVLQECFTVLMYAYSEFSSLDLAIKYAWKGGMRNFSISVY